MNKVILKGRLVRDPEIRYTSINNLPVATISIAVDRKFAKEGEQSCDFINCTAWDRMADFLQRYFKKGQEILVMGRLEISQYEKDGEKKSRTNVVIETIEFCGSKKDLEEQPTDVTNDVYAGNDIVGDDSDMPF